MTDINWWAVLAASVASMIVGSIWYGPLFGKKFISAMGWDNLPQDKRDAMKKGMGMTYFWQFVASLVMFYFLAWLIDSLDRQSLTGGLQTAICLWVGVVIPLKLGDALWGGKKVLFWLNIGNMLFTLLAAGAIIGAWR